MLVLKTFGASFSPYEVVHNALHICRGRSSLYLSLREASLHFTSASGGKVVAAVSVGRHILAGPARGRGRCR